MPIYLVTKDGKTNHISAEESFVVAQAYDAYELVPNNEPEEPDLSEEDLSAQLSREWRNEELKNSDWIVAVTDHPQRADYITYRETLRSWPADEANFPDTKPTLGE